MNGVERQSQSQLGRISARRRAQVLIPEKATRLLSNLSAQVSNLADENMAFHKFIFQGPDNDRPMCRVCAIRIMSGDEVSGMLAC